MEEESIKKLEGKKLMLVPPEIDCPRELKVKMATPKSKNIFELEFYEKADESLNFEAKSLLMEKSDFSEVFGELASAENELIGKSVEDKNLGLVGMIKDISGTQAQKLLVIDRDGREVLVPYVEEFILSAETDVVKTDLPTGILELNEA